MSDLRKIFRRRQNCYQENESIEWGRKFESLIKLKGEQYEISWKSREIVWRGEEAWQKSSELRHKEEIKEIHQMIKSELDRIEREGKGLPD